MAALCAAWCAALCAAWCATVGSVQAQPASPCAFEPTARGRVRSVDRFLDIVLANGDRLRLSGVEAPAPSPRHADWPQIAARRLGRWLVGRQIDYAPAGSPDRWGLQPVRAEAQAPGAAPGGGELDIGRALLEAGLARLDPDGPPATCLAVLRMAEAGARAAKLGLWADPYYAVIAAGDRGALLAHGGRVVLVEGRVLDLGSSGPRTYLNFGPRRGTDFSVVILKKNLPGFGRAGMTPQSLVGHRLLLRGLLDLRFGPQVEAFSPDQIDILDRAAGGGVAQR